MLNRCLSSISFELVLLGGLFLCGCQQGQGFFNGGEDEGSWDNFLSLYDGELYPADDLFLFVGDVLPIMCTSRNFALHSNASTFFFILTYKKNQKEITLNSYAYNTTHATTDFEVQEDMKGRGTLSCVSRPNGGEELQLASTAVFVQERLKNVTNISSVWDYPTKTFQVTWDLGVDYFEQEASIVVLTTWDANRKTEDGKNNCSHPYANQNHCYLPPKVFKSQTILSFHIIVKPHESWWDKYLKIKDHIVGSQSLEFTHYIYDVETGTKVKPGPPENIRVKTRASTCVNLTWENPKYFNYSEKDALCRIFVQDQQYNSNMTVEVANSMLEYGEPNIVQICDLHPNTLYTLRVQLKPIKGGYWSEPAEHSVTTSEDKPMRGPPMTTTSFLVGTCDNGERNVILYWRDLTPFESNGILTNFLVFFRPENGEVKSGEVRTSDNHLLTRMECHVSYNVSVYSNTQVGQTSHPSRLYLPSQDDAFHPPFPVDVKVEKIKISPENNLKVDLNVTWDVPDLSSFQGVKLVFYYCQGQNFQRQICLDDYKYTTVPFDQQYQELRDLDQKVNMFGFALVSNTNHVTGVTWADCVFERDEKPLQVTDVKSHPGDDAGSILVFWKAQRCSRQTFVLVLFYTVQYCTRSKKCSELHIAGHDVSTTTLQDLDIDETYTITVTAESFGKKTGVPSLPVTAKPKKPSIDDESTIRNVGIICGILVVLFLALTIFIVMRKCKELKLKVSSLQFYTPFDISSIEETKSQSLDSSISTVSKTATRTTTETVVNGGFSNCSLSNPDSENTSNPNPLKNDERTLNKVTIQLNVATLEPVVGDHGTRKPIYQVSDILPTIPIQKAKVDDINEREAINKSIVAAGVDYMKHKDHPSYFKMIEVGAGWDKDAPIKRTDARESISPSPIYTLDMRNTGVAFSSFPLNEGVSDESKMSASASASEGSGPSSANVSDNDAYIMVSLMEQSGEVEPPNDSQRESNDGYVQNVNDVVEKIHSNVTLNLNNDKNKLGQKKTTYDEPSNIITVSNANMSDCIYLQHGLKSISESSDSGTSSKNENAYVQQSTQQNCENNSYVQSVSPLSPEQNDKRCHNAVTAMQSSYVQSVPPLSSGKNDKECHGMVNHKMEGAKNIQKNVTPTSSDYVSACGDITGYLKVSNPENCTNNYVSSTQFSVDLLLKMVTSDKSSSHPEDWSATGGFHEDSTITSQRSDHVQPEGNKTSNMFTNPIMTNVKHFDDYI